MARFRLIVDVDIERPPSDYMVKTYVQDGIAKALAPKKLNHGEVRVYVNPVDPVEEAALSLAAAILRHAEDKADVAACGAVDRHEDHYNHGLID